MKLFDMQDLIQSPQQGLWDKYYPYSHFSDEEIEILGDLITYCGCHTTELLTLQKNMFLQDVSSKDVIDLVIVSL